MKLWFARATALALLLLASTADAHVRSESFSSWRLHEAELVAVFSVSAREATRLAVAGESDAQLGVLLARHLGETVEARAGGEPCARNADPTSLRASSGHVRVEMRWLCAGARPLELTIGAFFALIPSHVHLARLSVDAEPVAELVFSERSQTRVALAAKGSSPSGGFASWIWLGIEHISLGPDHLAFLVALLLFARRAREVAVIVTGFTLGHSLTLALGALGLAHPEPALIEAAIGFTIALVAAENVTSASGDSVRVSVAVALALAGLAGIALLVGRGPTPLLLLGLALFTSCQGRLASTPDAARRLRPALALVFGLVHGFGFAGVLGDFGLPRDRLVVALLGFNLGVELGQLAFIAAFALLARLLWRIASEAHIALARDLATAALCGLGVYWFVGRGYALLAP